MATGYVFPTGNQAITLGILSPDFRPIGGRRDAQNAVWSSENRVTGVPVPTLPKISRSEDVSGDTRKRIKIYPIAQYGFWNGVGDKNI
jgi:hypothetical protein